MGGVTGGATAGVVGVATGAVVDAPVAAGALSVDPPPHDAATSAAPSAATASGAVRRITAPRLDDRRIRAGAAARSLVPVKTRTLLLLALACGLAIMGAGAAFLVQLATRDDPAPASELGTPVRVGDMQVTVLGADEAGGALTVSIEIGGTVDDQPADEFGLVASGRPVGVAGTTCMPSSTSTQRCEVRFDVSLADGSSRVLLYQRGEDRARWVLA
jgi:hypothetical protein